MPVERVERILLMRRDSTSLTRSEMDALRRASKNPSVEYVRIDPRNGVHHYELCQVNPGLVLLPATEQVPVIAMRHGVRHIIVNEGGQVMELVELPPPIFKPFKL